MKRFFSSHFTHAWEATGAGARTVVSKEALRHERVVISSSSPKGVGRRNSSGGALMVSSGGEVIAEIKIGTELYEG